MYRASKIMVSVEEHAPSFAGTALIKVFSPLRATENLRPARYGKQHAPSLFFSLAENNNLSRDEAASY